jgi:hypothetical protein
MKSYFLIVFLTFTLIGCGQEIKISQKNLINNLKEIENLPYLPELSGDSIFWAVVKEGLNIVPLLIEKLDDTTITNAIVPNFGGFYTVADISNEIIATIIKDIPITEFVVKSDSTSGGYWYYWDYVRADIENRKLYKKKVKNWYQKNKSNLLWQEDNKIYRTSPDWKFESNKHPAGGYYILKKG